MSICIHHCSSNLRTHCSVGPDITLQSLQFCRRGRLKTSVLLIGAPINLTEDQFSFKHLSSNRPVKYDNGGDVKLMLTATAACRYLLIENEAARQTGVKLLKDGPPSCNN